MSNKNVTLKEKVNGVLGDTIFPATITPNVYDSAKGQALSQTLVNTPDYEALGFAKFSTASAYSAGDKVYKDNELYRFIADKAAGEWDVAKVEPWSIEQEIEEVDDAIRSLIPAQASAYNKLADKEYVNDKVSTDTATFRGTFNLVSDLHLTTSATQGQIATALGTAISGEDKNDYAFVQIPTSDATPTEIARIDRYKYTGLQWAFEYSLNNSGFTAEQWAAINSGITSSLVTAFGAKYDKPAGGIPKTDLAEGVQTSLNKADSALQPEVADEAYARKDGFYEDLTAGNAVNILSEDVVTEQTTLYVTAPNNEIGNGSARMQTIEGDGVAWSQLYDKKAGGASVASEQGQLEFLFSKVVERFTTWAGTTPMPCLFLREFLTGADLTGRVAVSGEVFVPAVTEENQSNYTGLHYKVRATHAEAVQRSGEEGSYSYSSAFFVGGANFSASAKRNVIDMALAFGIERDNYDQNFRLPDSAPCTLAQMYGWLGSKVGLRDDYDYNGGELIGVKVLQLRSMPGVNLLDPTSGVALCPYYEWENADGLYRIAARNGAVISGVAATALGGQPVAVVEVTAGSVYEVSVPEGDAVVMQVTLSSGSLADCACWQVWDDATPSDEVGGYSRSVMELPITRLVGQQDGTGSFVRFAPQGFRGVYGGIRDILNAADSAAKIKIKKINPATLSYGITSGYVVSSSPINDLKAPVNQSESHGRMNICAPIGIQPLGKSCERAFAFESSKKLWFRVKQFENSATGFTNWLSSNNAELWYELNTYLTYTNLYLLPADAEGDTFAELPAGSVPLSTYFPGTYQVGNTGVTMQTANWDDQTQRFAATPLSLAAQTSSVMPGNYVELLRSLQQKNILDGWVSPDQMHAHQSATVQALNAMATANQLSGQFTLTPQDDVAYSNG